MKHNKLTKYQGQGYIKIFSLVGWLVFCQLQKQRNHNSELFIYLFSLLTCLLSTIPQPRPLGSGDADVSSGELAVATDHRF